MPKGRKTLHAGHLSSALIIAPLVWHKIRFCAEHGVDVMICEPYQRSRHRAAQCAHVTGCYTAKQMAIAIQLSSREGHTRSRIKGIARNDAMPDHPKRMLPAKTVYMPMDYFPGFFRGHACRGTSKSPSVLIDPNCVCTFLGKGFFKYLRIPLTEYGLKKTCLLTIHTYFNADLTIFSPDNVFPHRFNLVPIQSIAPEQAPPRDAIRSNKKDG